MKTIWLRTLFLLLVMSTIFNTLPVFAQTPDAPAKGCAYKDYKPIGKSIEQLQAVEYTPAFGMAKEYLNERGFELKQAEGFYAKSDDSSVETFVLPIQGQSPMLLDPIPLTVVGDTKISALKYNSKYTSQNLESANGWMIFINRPELSLTFYVEALKFQGDQQPVLVLTAPGGGKLVLNFQKDLLYGVTPPESSSTESAMSTGTQSSIGFSDLWDCIKQFIGIPTSKSISQVLNSICTLPDSVKVIVALAASCVDCGTVIGCADCVLAWAGYLTCASANIIACYNGTSSVTPTIFNITTSPTPPKAGTFNFTITGKNIVPGIVRVIFTGPGCPNGCAVPGAGLSYKSSSQLEGQATLAAGHFNVKLQNGSGAFSNLVAINVVSGGSSSLTLTGTVLPGQWSIQNFNVPSGKSKIIVTLNWPGNNDIDLHLTSASGLSYGWNTNTTGYSGYSSHPEVIQLNSPTSGTWKLRVHAYSATGGTNYSATIQFQ